MAYIAVTQNNSLIKNLPIEPDDDEQACLLAALVSTHQALLKTQVFSVDHIVMTGDLRSWTIHMRLASVVPFVIQGMIVPGDVPAEV